MKWFKNWKIKTKILSLVVLMSIFTGLVGIVGYISTTAVTAQLDTMYSNSLMSVSYIDDAQAQSRKGESTFFLYLLAQDDATRKKLQAEIQTSSDNFAESYSSFVKLATDSYEKERIAKLDQEISTFRTERQKSMDLLNQGKYNEAYLNFTSKAQSQLDSINTTLDELSTFNVQEAATTKASNDIANIAIKRIVTFLPIIATLLGLLLGYLIAILIANSIKKVLEGVEQVAQGNLSTPDIELSNHDETSQLAASFNVMKQHLHSLVKHVSQSAEQVTASSDELSAITEENTQSANEIAAAIEKVAQATEKEAGAIDETSSAIAQISASTQEAAASTSEITESMTKTLKTTQAGKEALVRVIQQMNNISNGTNNVQQSITELSTSSGQIGEIIEMITGIAEQTNLLALNAAIEAARAGEHGRGFAVVAEEVRKLAEQSREAAKQISSLIHQNNSNFSTVVTAMEGEVKNVHDGLEVVNEAEQSFNEISGLIENVTAQMEEISATIQQIASGSQQILTSAEHIDQISKETSSHAQTVSAGVEEQTASIEQIASSAQNLATMASELQNVISKFTI